MSDHTGKHRISFNPDFPRPMRLLISPWRRDQGLIDAQDREVVKFLAATAEMVEAILKDKKKVLPCSVFLKGEYGIDGLFVGVPVKLGAAGVEQIVEVKLTAEEDAALKKSAGAVKELVDIIGV